MLEWLLSPIDASRAHDVGPHLSWHARSMFLAWGCLVPFGILSARYFKVLPKQDWPMELDNQTWWVAHRIAQYSALAFMMLGLYLILTIPASAASVTSAIWVHRLLGWTTLSLGAHQFLSGWLRGTKGGPTDPRGQMRGDHYDMSIRRVIFERLHKTSGYLALVCAVLAMLTGLWQANAPRYMWIGILLFWGGLGLAIMLIAPRLRRIPTYEAIWGPKNTRAQD
jgi:hypothetical protein